MRKPPKNPYEMLLQGDDALPDSAVTEIGTTRSVRTESTRHGGLNAILVFPNPKKPTKPQELKLTGFTDFPMIAEAMARGLSSAIATFEPPTRRARVGQLNASLGTYLKETIPEAEQIKFSLIDITTELLADFVEWLDRPGKNKNNHLTRRTRMVYLSIVRSTLNHIPAALNDPSIFSNLVIPDRVWLDVDGEAKPREVIGIEDFSAIYSACIVEIAEIVDRFNRFSGYLDDDLSSDDPLEHHKGSSSERTVVRAIDATFPAILPGFMAIKAEHPRLYKQLMKHDHRAVVEIFNPTGRTFIPFIIMLSIHSAHNPGVVLSYEDKDFRFYSLFGEDRIKLDPYKNRSADYQARSFPVVADYDNPGFLVEFISEITARIRTCCDPIQVSKRFIFVPARTGSGRDKAVVTFGEGDLSSSVADVNWFWNLGKFIKKHNLVKFSLAQIRTTVLDIVDDLTDGDLRAIQMIGGQKSPQVIAQHYTSDAAKKRGEERLAHAQNFIQRDLGTEAKLDARRATEERSDKGAATPGFGCQQPYDSPWPDQTKGRLCQAYGQCPICPLGQLDLNSPYACHRAHELLERVDEAAETMPFAQFKLRWIPVRAKLINTWLPGFSQDVLDAASKLDLPRLPPIS